MSSSRTHRSVSPPGLSRASTPESFAPSTPVLSSSFPQSAKMAAQKSHVGFASPTTTSSFRHPHSDERSVMRAFSTHAAYCSTCRNPKRVVAEGGVLCQTGTELAIDIGKYFFCCNGKPYSQIDRAQGQDRVQVDVPPTYAIVKDLFEALQQGLRFTKLRSRRTEVHQSQAPPAPVRAATMPENYEYTPARSHSRRQRPTTYTGYSAVADYETRTPYDKEYREPSEKERKPRSSRKESNRGSLFEPEERRKRKSYLVTVPSVWSR